MTDITTCFNTLKRAFQDAYASKSANAQLQMAQPTVRYALRNSNELFDIHAEHRPDAVTLATNPTAEFALDFDNLFTVSIALPLPVPVEFSHDAQDWDERDKSDGGTFIVYCLVHSQFILWATHRGQW